MAMLVLVVVFVFDLVAFALAVAAEQRRTTAAVVQSGNTRFCAYDSDIATGLGVGSLLFLFASQVIIMVASRCLCCGKSLRPSGSRAWAVTLFITCWVCFLIAETCLLAASVRNAYHTKYMSSIVNEQISCKMLRKGVFGAGAAFIVFTCVASELFYVSFSKAHDQTSSFAKDTGIRMANL
ncbi:uncharacterized protein LOC111010632 [Momordica charantia]|uniref:Uncharacterized protein LOC111010632 n=1 Tax=Momordica charantia TaxID=3673 RepID=A0A6J1CEZ1_MOMCH|nr:uncharacterized protein LOC111010632 [Momordica charantia]XP_022139806.1 uncharacterized protein LOC111010632 [Momordica charantia]XP_022139807.1 uncharacterized protein LOC111010632 [Momordica charantia]